MPSYMHSGVTGSLSQEWKNLAEGGPLATVRGHYQTLRKKTKKWQWIRKSTPQNSWKTTYCEPKEY